MSYKEPKRNKALYWSYVCLPRGFKPKFAERRELACHVWTREELLYMVETRDIFNSDPKDWKRHIVA